jgi:hypothetical protein
VLAFAASSRRFYSVHRHLLDIDCILRVGRPAIGLIPAARRVP